MAWTEVILDDNPTAIAGKGNPHGTPQGDLRLLRRRVTTDSTSGTITAPYRISHIEGFDDTANATQTITNTHVGGGSVAVANVSSGRVYYITIVCVN